MRHQSTDIQMIEQIMTDRPSVGSDLRFIRSRKPSLANAASGEHAWRDGTTTRGSHHRTGRRRSAVTVWASRYRRVGSLKGRLGKAGWASGVEYDNPEESSRRLAFQGFFGREPGFWERCGVFGKDAVLRQSPGTPGTPSSFKVMRLEFALWRQVYLKDETSTG